MQLKRTNLLTSHLTYVAFSALKDSQKYVSIALLLRVTHLYKIVLKQKTIVLYYKTFNDCNCKNLECLPLSVTFF